jgi:hypothetical protein
MALRRDIGARDRRFHKRDNKPESRMQVEIEYCGM